MSSGPINPSHALRAAGFPDTEHSIELRDLRKNRETIAAVAARILSSANSSSAAAPVQGHTVGPLSAGGDAVAQVIESICHRIMSSSQRTDNLEAVSRAVIVTARNGNLDDLSKLLSGEVKVSPADLGLALCAASRSGEEDVVRFLLSKVGDVTGEDLGKAVILAAGSGHINIVEFLLGEGRPIGKADLEAAIRLACQKGHDAIAIKLLKSGSSDENFMALSMRIAMEYSRVPVLEACLSHRLYSLGDLLILASATGGVKIVENILNRGGFGDETLKAAISDAAKNNRLETVQFFLSSKSIPKKLKKALLKDAVLAAARHNRSELIKALSVSSEDLKKPVLAAAESGSLDALQVLLSYGDSSFIYDLGQIVFDAARNNNSKLISTLGLLQGGIPQKVLENAVVSAVRSKSLEALKVLFSDGRSISKEALGQAVEYAAEHPSPAVLEVLLDGRSVSAEALGTAIWAAARDNHPDFIPHLLRLGGDISLQALKEAKGIAERNRRDDVILALKPYMRS